jgi:hypothetical protein
MSLGHGIVDFCSQFRLAGGTGKIDQTEGYPATGYFINATMIGGGDKQDFLKVCGCFYLSSPLKINELSYGFTIENRF